MRFVNHSFGDGPQVVSQTSDLLGTILKSTTRWTVGITRHYGSEVGYTVHTLDCWLSLDVWVRCSTAGVLGLLLAYYDTYVGRIVVTEWLKVARY